MLGDAMFQLTPGEWLRTLGGAVLLILIFWLCYVILALVLG
jgi:hypothetical protein